jgi:hypothetical protein
MFPPEWSEKKGGGKRKRAEEVAPPGDARTEAAPQAADGDLRALLEECGRAVGDRETEYPDGVVDQILLKVNDTKFAPAVPEELQLDHVLSGVPYQSMLESLFGGLSSAEADVPLVTKAYEESFMREAGQGEAGCSMGELCECRFIDKNAPFVGVQFQLPQAPSDSKPKMCVLCYRKTTQRLFYDMCYQGKRIHGLIQHYGNLCNQPGEYARCCMLICPEQSQHWQCMPRPIMSHQRNRYLVHVVAGMKQLVQLRVAHEDFVTPSDRTQG